VENEMKNTEKQPNQQNESASFMPDHDECFLKNESASKKGVVSYFMLTPVSEKRVKLHAKCGFYKTNR
jgi:hypothetical protein